MNISLEISLYPFAEDYPDDVKLFLEKIYSQPDLKVETNSMSTIITGDYHQVMTLINDEVFRFFENNKAVFVLKISNGCVV
jgi:uncharacterized protein YqgV (UPF0045/DUF77 family)